MTNRAGWLRIAILGILLLWPSVVSACPLCAEAIANSPTDDDNSNNLATAINQGIYLMVSVPYLMLGFVGYLIYRGCKKNAEYLAKQNEAFDLSHG